MKSMVDLSVYQEIILSILLYNGKYKLSDKNKNLYIRNFSKLLKLNPFNIQNNSANLTTLRNLSEQIYKRDLKMIVSQLPGVGNCSSAIRYLNEYKHVLSMALS